MNKSNRLSFERVSILTNIINLGCIDLKFMSVKGKKWSLIKMVTCI
ncbi:hypothetical protein GCM10007984_13260 [Shewanella putrefaciens]|nr:hypothetical protein GCM10007984_13260 [Shewanella putrefaciens]